MGIIAQLVRKIKAKSRPHTDSTPDSSAVASCTPDPGPPTPTSPHTHAHTSRHTHTHTSVYHPPSPSDLPSTRSLPAPTSTSSHLHSRAALPNQGSAFSDQGVRCAAESHAEASGAPAPSAASTRPTPLPHYHSIDTPDTSPSMRAEAINLTQAASEPLRRSVAIQAELHAQLDAAVEAGRCDARRGINVSVSGLQGPGPNSGTLHSPNNSLNTAASTSTSSTSTDLSDCDLDSQRELHTLATRIVHAGGWGRLGDEDRRIIVEHYRSRGLNLDTLMNQVQRESRVAVINNKLADLDYINWDHIRGLRGVASPLETISSSSSGNAKAKATLYRGRWHGEDVVVKKMDGADTRRMQDQLSREIYIMSTCTHPNIARIFGIAREPLSHAPCIVMKFYGRGSLLDVLTAPGAADAMGLAARIKMARGVARGMQYLHDRPNATITHGDLTPRNILVDEHMRPVITDFGLSAMTTQTRTLVPSSRSSGTRAVLYTAPEVLPMLLASAGRGYKPSREADVYAFSMIMFELFSGTVPFGGADMNEEKVLGLTACGQRPLIPRPSTDGSGGSDRGWSGEGGAGGAGIGIAGPLAAIITSCWDQDPAARPTFGQVIRQLEAAAAMMNVRLD